MTNRREFLRTGTSVSALSLGHGLLPTDALAHLERNSIIPHKAVFDDRYAEARTLAKALDKSGVRVHALNNGDVTELWHRERGLLRKNRRFAIAGTTQYGPMFVFEQLANEYGMRVALRVEHRPRGDGTIAHVMTGPQDSVFLAEQLKQHLAGWPEMMATLLTHCRAGAGICRDHTVLTPGKEPELTRGPEFPAASAPNSVIHYYTPQRIKEGRDIPWEGTLYSWLIAPAVPLPSQTESAHV